MMKQILFVILLVCVIVLPRYFLGFSDAFVNDYSRVHEQLDLGSRGSEGLLTRAEIYIFLYSLILGIDFNNPADLIILVTINSIIFALLINAIYSKFSFKRRLTFSVLVVCSINVLYILSTGSRESWTILLALFLLYIRIKNGEQVGFSFYAAAIMTLISIYLLRAIDIFPFILYIYYLLTMYKTQRLHLEIAALLAIVVSIVTAALFMFTNSEVVAYSNIISEYGDGGSSYLVEVGQNGFLDYVAYTPLLVLAFLSIPFSLNYIFIGVFLLMIKLFIIGFHQNITLFSKDRFKIILIYILSILPYAMIVRNQGGGLRWRVAADIILICMFIAMIFKNDSIKALFKVTDSEKTLQKN